MDKAVSFPKLKIKNLNVYLVVSLSQLPRINML